MTVKNKNLYPLNANYSKGFLKKLLLTDRYYLVNFRQFIKKIPSKIDLRDSGIYGSTQDQGNLETSIGFSLVKGCLEYTSKKDLNLHQELSVIYVYKKDRNSFFVDPRRTVTTFLDALEVLIFQGCCPEIFDGYGYKSFFSPKSTDLDTLAQTFRLKRVFRMSKIREIKSCLSEGYPVASLFRLFPSLFDVFVYRSGEIPVPSDKETAVGTHALTIVGYDDSKKSFIVRNSWSKSWGELGYGYLPYDAFQKMHLESYSLRL